MPNNDTIKTMQSEKKSLIIKPFSQIHKGALLYYILSFVVLFFNIFILKSDNLYRVGYQEFAKGFGWIYYLTNAIGIIIALSPLLKFLDNIATKIISIINLVVSGLLLFKTIPETIKQTGSIVSIIGEGELGIGFWLILGLHTVAVLIFWFFFIRKISKRRGKKIKEGENDLYV